MEPMQWDLMSLTSGDLSGPSGRGQSSLGLLVSSAKSLLLLSVAAIGSLGSAQTRPDGGRPGTDGGAFCFYDGGPGGCCTNDSDCLGCGWVCSWRRGGYCIPSMEGDPGHCTVDGDCACAGQHCSVDHCAPAASPACACNSDCPSGEVCDQLTFACHAQPASCSTLFGSCGCGFLCGSTQGRCVAQGNWFPPECASDLDCNVCETGKICRFNPNSPLGQFTCVEADGGWCPHSGGGADGGQGNGDGGSDGGASGLGPAASGCGCDLPAPSPDGSSLLAFGLGLVALGSRRGRAMSGAPAVSARPDDAEISALSAEAKTHFAEGTTDLVSTAADWYETEADSVERFANWSSAEAESVSTKAESLSAEAESV